MARRKGGRETKYKGVKDLGNGSFRIRLYWKDPKTGETKERDRIVQAASATEAHALRRTLEVVDADRAAEPMGPRTIGDAADTWLREITSRRLEEDPAQLHLCHATKLRYEGSVRDFIKP